MIYRFESRSFCDCCTNVFKSLTYKNQFGLSQTCTHVVNIKSSFLHDKRGLLRISFNSMRSIKSHSPTSRLVYRSKAIQAHSVVWLLFANIDLQQFCNFIAFISSSKPSSKLIKAFDVNKIERNILIFRTRNSANYSLRFSITLWVEHILNPEWIQPVK